MRSSPKIWLKIKEDTGHWGEMEGDWNLRHLIKGPMYRLSHLQTFTQGTSLGWTLRQGSYGETLHHLEPERGLNRLLSLCLSWCPATGQSTDLQCQACLHRSLPWYSQYWSCSGLRRSAHFTWSAYCQEWFVAGCLPHLAPPQGQTLLTGSRPWPALWVHFRDSFKQITAANTSLGRSWWSMGQSQIAAGFSVICDLW